MANTKKKIDYSLIAAIIYTVIAVCTIIEIISIPDYRSVYLPKDIRNFSFMNGIIVIQSIVNWIVLVGLPVTLFMKNKRAVAAIAGIQFSYRFFISVYSLRIWPILNSLDYAVLIGLIVLAIKGNKCAKKIWFLPCALFFSKTIIGCIRFGFTFFTDNSGAMGILDILQIIAEFFALLFVGMWIKDNISLAATTTANEYATFDPNAYIASCSNAEIGGADNLKMYKELLDSGTISQKEFDEMKKQILEL